MVHRQDAYRALQKLSRGNYKVNQKSIKIAWALNKGIKADYKQYWDVELGVTYVPWDKVKPEELESFCEGGMLDSDTLNPVVSGPRGNAESGDSAKMYGSAVPPAAPANLPTPPVTQPVSLLGKFIIFLLLVFTPFKFGFLKII